MKEPVKVLMVAINGYGHYYLKTMLEETDCEDAVLVGIVDPEARKSIYYNAFREFGIPVFDILNDFYLSGGKADLAVISSPPHFHIPQTVFALHNGTNVLCEKPVGGCPEDIRLMTEKRDKTGKFVMIGYQWSFSEGIQLLKNDILGGKFGKPLRMKSICMWPRDFAYFSRNSWAYRKKDVDGNCVMDNLFNNAMSHFIHNMFFLLGDSAETSASPERMEIITARANNVETYDTGVLRAYTGAGTELLFCGSHAAEKRVDPAFRIEFEKGFVELKPGGSTIMARCKGMEDFSYPSPDSDHQFRKLFRAIDLASGRGRVYCPPEAAISQALVVYEKEEKYDNTFVFGPERITKLTDRLFVPELDDLLLNCYKEFRIPDKKFTRLI